MIRQANKYDKTEIIEIIKLFRDESEIDYVKPLRDETYINNLLDSLLVGRGIIFIEEGVGLIMGVIVPTIWCDKIYALQELAWYVKPEFRGGTVGYRLFKEFLKYGEQLKEQKRIAFTVISKLPTSPNLNYSKFGFRKMDENWIK